ncbi:MAG: acyl carrier protein [Chloroflexi bacterium]|jgi:acyl carrier protein|nr:acyl carrier protein [Chloroflexota bacterium]
MTTDKTMDVEETLRKIVAKIIRKEDVVLNPTTTFKELGADSLDVVQVLVALEETYDIELVDEELKAITDMGSFIAYVKKKVAEKK